MPTDPHTWADLTDWLSAFILNGDFRSYNGQEFTPTGVNFHARRPIYRSFYSHAGVPPSVATGSWVEMYSVTGGGSNLSTPVGDTGGLFASWMDSFLTGNIQLSIAGGGGLPGTPGGLVLMSGYSLWNAGTGGNIGSGLGDRTLTAATNGGTFQANNTAHLGCPFTVDLVDGNAVRWTVWGFNGTGAGITPSATANTDGSGGASRLQAHWVSVYPANGFTVATLPAPVASWSTSTALTANLLNGSTGIRAALRYLNMPPLARLDTSNNQALTSSTANVISLGSATYDTYAGWSSGTNTYTVPFNGLYLVHGLVTVNNFSGSLRAGVSINGTNYWGPYAPAPASGQFSSCKNQIFSLNAGDTIQLTGWPTAAATATHSRLVVLQVGNQGAPATLPTNPDTSWRWAAGTAGPLDPLFNAHVANDLLFLTQRPYLLSYQTAAQSGIAMNTSTQVNMDTVKGLVHADNGDNYQGWSAANGNYVCQRNGWYMAVFETFLAQPTLTATPFVTALASVTPNSGTAGWDRYQQCNMITGGQVAPGAGGIAYYFLRKGDTITPGVFTGDSSATTISTAVSSPNNLSHFELVWIGE